MKNTVTLQALGILAFMITAPAFIHARDFDAMDRMDMVEREPLQIEEPTEYLESQERAEERLELESQSEVDAAYERPQDRVSQ